MKIQSVLLSEEFKNISYLNSQIDQIKLSIFCPKDQYLHFFLPSAECIAVYLGALRNNHVVYSLIHI